jgi:CRP/FNR family transcriptional regulator
MLNEFHLDAISPVQAPGACPDCGLFSWCLSANLNVHESMQFNNRIEHRRLITRNEYLHHAGAALSSLYVIHSGFLKTSMTDSNGREQVTGFSITRDLVGMDAIGTSKHQCDTIALEDSHLCGMRYSDLEELGCVIPALQRHFHRVMGAEIARDHGVMLMLGSMRVEQRVAVFLLNLSKRFRACGYSGTHFRLPMTRREIASYLGVRLETISRVFSHFNNTRLIAMDGKDIEIENLVRLQQIIEAHDTRRPRLRRTRSGAN